MQQYEASPSYPLPPVGYYPYPYGYHPMTSQVYPAPFRASSDLPAPSSILTPSASSSNSSPSESGDENLSAAASREPSRLFRPVDFDNTTRTISANSYYQPCPTPDSESEKVDSPPSCSGISASMVEKELWASFGDVGNEMIVTKPGRRFFPAVLVSVRGLNPRVKYEITLKVSPTDGFRYKFYGHQWVAVGESEVLQNETRQIFRHPNSPSTGDFWMKKPISFKSVKITHNHTSKNGDILVHTMHKYTLKLLVQPVGLLGDVPPIIVPVPDTDFVAVTSYQNTTLTQLKIDNNPFAKGFRDRENTPPFLPYYPPGTTLTLGYPPLWQMPHFAMPAPPQGLHSPLERNSASSPAGGSPTHLPMLQQPRPHVDARPPAPSMTMHHPIPFQSSYGYPRAWTHGPHNPGSTSQSNSSGSPVSYSADCSDVDDDVDV